MIKTTIQSEIMRITGVEEQTLFTVERSQNFGDYATNAAMALAKARGKDPRELAKELAGELERSEALAGIVSKVEVAGPGFINFYLKDEVFSEHVKEILESGDEYGKSDALLGQKIIIEYTDPNPFKEFHIGHLMANAIGESLSRILSANGADVKRACYQGDVGMHVAKAVYGIRNLETGIRNASDLGRAYAVGAQAYENDKNAKEEIQEINKKIYEKSDPEINAVYEEGKDISMEYFESMYKKLGTRFDFYFAESETGPVGTKIVEENLGKVFEKGEGGAVIFKGEDHGLHTRVFLNSEGLPTYEAKELGLAQIKYEKYPYERSIIVTANEVNDYFQVLLRAMYLIFPELEKKTQHISHGILRLPSGKMSSRTGDVITAAQLIFDLEGIILKKIKDRELEDKEKVAEEIAIGAIKYSILKQSPGKDVIFDLEKSISFEGDSGAYLQYTYVRTQSILRKAEILPSAETTREEPEELSKMLFEGLPNALSMALHENAPNYIASYLSDLSRAFNAYYEKNQILGNEHTPYRLALVSATGIVLKNGLSLLGIPTPEKM